MRASASSIALTIAEELVAQGVIDVVVSPGSRSAPLALAVAGRPELRVHVRIDERTAGFLAVGLGRGSGRPAALVCSSGTATANYHPAVMEADAAGVPLLVLTADRPVELRDVGANQTATQAGLYGTAVRWSHQLGEAGDATGAYVRSVVARAVACAIGGPGPGGPVHLDVPLREPLLDPGAGPLAGRGPRRIVLPRPAAAADLPAELSAATVLGGRRRGLVIAGEGAAGDPATLDVAAALGYPVLAEPTSGLRLRHPAIRTGHWLAASEAFIAAEPPDVVVLLGRPVLSRPIGALAARAEQVVVCDPLDRGWDPWRSATHVVAARFQDWVGPALADLPPAPGWLDRWVQADRVAAEVLDGQLDGEDRLTELGTARDLAAAMPDGGALVVGSSLAVRHLNETMVPRDGLRVVGNRGVSGIDGFVSTAVGVALGHGGPTAALCGDLSIVHDLTGLVIGRDEPRPTLPIVVINNGGGGIFDLLPYGSSLDPDTFRRLFLTPHDVPLEGLAITLGCGHTGAGSPAGLVQAVEDAWATPGITLVEVTTDTATETARLRAIQQAITTAVG